MAQRPAAAVPELPRDIQVEYLAEGAANVIYRIRRARSGAVAEAVVGAGAGDGPGDGDGRFDRVEGEVNDDGHCHAFASTRELLRLRKALSTTERTAAGWERFQREMAPLFEPQHLVAQRLVRLPAGFARRCNEDLRGREAAGHRSSLRHGLYLDEEDPHGLLVTDMTPMGSGDESAEGKGREDTGQVLVEFKPKWLAQSPRAPRGARRCRTCALRAYRSATASSRKNPPDGRSFCPLDLVSQDASGPRRAVARIVDMLGLADPAKDALRQKLSLFLHLHPLLSRLRTLQERFDQVDSLSDPDSLSVEFLKAMSLRDCTVYIKCSPTLDVLEIRLGDLDLKRPVQSKLAYWRDQERILIDGGWYMAREAGDSPEQDGEVVQEEEEECRLMRAQDDR